MSTRATPDIDAYHDQVQTAQYLQRNGWQVTPPDDVFPRDLLCRTASCMTRVPRGRFVCHFCKRTKALARAGRRLRVAA